MKIFVLNGGITDMHWIENSAITHDVENADVILFTGGTDVNPELYGEARGLYTGFPDIARDTREQEIFETYKGIKPMIGICRGSQFLCVMNGGKLIQHMQHPAYHSVETFDGKTLKVNSTHHQMMYPFDANHLLLAWASISKMHLNGKNEQVKMPQLNGSPMEPEVVVFPETNCLCIQSHPEYIGYPENTNTWLNNVIDRYVRSKINAIPADASASIQ